jgi:hypothetical protein
MQFSSPKVGSRTNDIQAAYRPVFLPRFKATTSELSAH